MASTKQPFNKYLKVFHTLSIIKSSFPKVYFNVTVPSRLCCYMSEQKTILNQYFLVYPYFPESVPWCVGHV